MSSEDAESLPISTPNWEAIREFHTFRNPDDTPETETARENWWRNVCKIREIVSSSDVVRNGLPMYYPGSGGDILKPLALTDCEKYIFVDYCYINGEGSLAPRKELPDPRIERIGGQIIDIQTEGVLGQGGKRIVTFNWGDKKRQIVMYAEDATMFTPPEIANGFAFTMVDAPTAFTRGNRDDKPNFLGSPEYAEKIYQQLAKGGFILWVLEDFIF